MKENIKKLKMKKLPLAILLVVTISIILGILFLAIISKSDKELVSNTLNSFFKNISQNKYNTNNALFNSLSNNLIINFLIWILGISIIAIPIVFIILVAKGFVLGFSISSIIYNYGLKGIILAIIYILPHLLSLLTTIILSYFSINFSKILFQNLFLKKEYNKKTIIRRYLKILLFTTICYITSSVIEVYVIPKILYFFK